MSIWDPDWNRIQAGQEAPEPGFGCSAPDAASPEKPHPPVCSAPLAGVSPEVYAWPAFLVPTADP